MPMHLTDKLAKALRVNPGSADALYWDDEVRGLGLRVKAPSAKAKDGAKAWVIQYRNADHVSRRMTLGRFPTLTTHLARKRAKQLLADASLGKDPAEDKQAARKAVTVSQLCAEYLKAGEGRIKPSTLAADRGRIEAHVKPLLGSRTVASLRPSDVEKFMRDITAGKTAKEKPTAGTKTKPGRGGIIRGGAAAAIRVTEMLGTVLQRAVRDGVLATNPARGLRRKKEQPIPPTFAFDTVTAVGAAMREIEGEELEKFKALRPATVTALDAVRVLVLTGCRRMEVLTLQWGDVDFAGRCFRFRDTKTGKQVRPIGRAALDHLASFRPKDAKPGDYVFAGLSKAGHFVGLPKSWARIATRAKVEAVSLHGLRHWFASAAAEMNYSDFVIGGMLGHAKRGITGRYANTPDAALASAADRVAARMQAALDGKQESNLVRLGGATAATGGPDQPA
jgi:integrase